LEEELKAANTQREDHYWFAADYEAAPDIMVLQGWHLARFWFCSALLLCACSLLVATRGARCAVRGLASKAELTREFLYACHTVDYACVVRLLQKGVPAEASGPDGRNGLMEECDGVEAFSDKLADLLVARGVRTGKSDTRGNTALMLAAGSENTAAVAYLLRRGVSPNRANADGRTALMLACYSQEPQGENDVVGIPCPQCVRLLLDHGGSPNRHDNRGNTALHYACTVYPYGGSDGYSGEQLQIIGRLLRHGARINAVNGSGETALFAAVRSCTPSNYDDTARILAYLLRHGAATKIRNKHGQTAAQLARLLRCPAIIARTLRLAVGPGNGSVHPDKARPGSGVIAAGFTTLSDLSHAAFRVQ